MRKDDRRLPHGRRQGQKSAADSGTVDVRLRHQNGGIVALTTELFQAAMKLRGSVECPSRDDPPGAANRNVEPP